MQLNVHIYAYKTLFEPQHVRGDRHREIETETETETETERERERDYMYIHRYT